MDPSKMKIIALASAGLARIGVDQHHEFFQGEDHHAAKCGIDKIAAWKNAMSS